MKKAGTILYTILLISICLTACGKEKEEKGGEDNKFTQKGFIGFSGAEMISTPERYYYIKGFLCSSGRFAGLL